MNKKIKKAFTVFLPAFIAGITNGLLGTGGGIIAVSLLKKDGLTQKQAQANAIAVILPITVLSTLFYICRGYVDIRTALPYVPGGIVGAVFGTKLLNKISNKHLKKIFACFILWAGIRLLKK